MDNLEKVNADIAGLLVHKIRPMTAKEQELAYGDVGRFQNPVIIELVDRHVRPSRRVIIYGMQDPEGNGPGALVLFGQIGPTVEYVLG